MLRLLPLMENEGLTFAEAAARVYGKELHMVPVAENLRPVREAEESGWIGHIPNPVVKRVLSELRKVVNPIVQEYGVPAKIRVELARSLKSTAEERQEYVEENKKQRRAREDAKRILREHNCPTGRDWENRILLYNECMKLGGNECVYCGEPLTSGKGAYGELLATD